MRALRPSHQHTAYSATLLVTGAIALSRVIGYLREAYIAWAFGAGPRTDAFVAAFTLPDFINYLLAGGTASITFISIYTRYHSSGREKEAQHTFSIVISIMSALLAVFIAAAEWFTPEFTRWWFSGFDAAQVQLCVTLTRILLPAQLFFVIGGVTSAVLQSKRMFLLPALAPVIYNASIILGGLLGSHRYGISSLAFGALAGAFAGPFLINAIGAGRTGIGFRPSFHFGHAGFREWIVLSVPLMLGVSLVAADDWIMRYFASGGAGDITRLNYAKRLIGVPIAVIGQASGQAALPFFAKLFGEKHMAEFRTIVGRAIGRVAGASFLLTAWMMAAALPVIDLVYRRGRFSFTDSRETAALFFWFSVSLVFWAAQGLYARAFYAAGNTLTPMLAGTMITMVSIPVYGALYHRWNVVGLAIASDIGIAAHTVVLAWLLHRKRLVPAGALPWKELLKLLGTASLAGFTAYLASGVFVPDGSRVADLASLGLVSATWAAAASLGLWATKVSWRSPDTGHE
ncbi:MAG: murein biosynthesis integral membrane protein MurJ [Terriglobales bacterium]